MDSDLEQYLPFVKAVAKRYAEDEGQITELISAGWWGLLEAREKFDERSGVRFITYAVWYIRRSILSYLQDKEKV